MAWSTIEVEKEPPDLVDSPRPPMTYHDGEHFPEDVKQIQHRDLRPWNRASPGFLQTADYYQFIGEMQAVADEIAGLISAAPGWRDDFPVVLPPGALGDPVAQEVPRL